MKNKFVWRILGLFLFLAMTGNAWSQEVLITNYDKLTASIMRPDRESRLKWMEDYEMAPRAFIDTGINLKLTYAQTHEVGTSLSLLNYLQYTSNERDQGGCGNCWVWAGTGIMEIANSVQSGIKDRFSIQFLNSCKSGSYACCGGSLSGFASWYGNQGFAVPWSNTNASFQDGSRQCSDNSSVVSCGSISTSPDYYPFTSIQTQTINTTSVSQSTAIANIKNVLNQNKGVWFGFWLADDPDWNAFFNFWSNQTEATLWNPDDYCGHTWNDYEGGGHAVLIVGYNDDDLNPANHYWLVLNSWGTTGGRPNGLFRMPAQMNYVCTISEAGYGYWYSRQFQTLGVTFSNSPTIGYSPASFSFTATQGGSNPQDKSLSIWNAGSGTLSWSVSDDATWLSLSPVSGTNSGNVTVSVNITGLTAGTYYATITIAATGATNSPVNIPVTLTVKPLRTYSVSGTVRTSRGTPIPSVTITLSGNATGSTITDSLGRYRFTGLANGSYTVTPGMTDYTFTPASRTVTISGVNATGQNFTGTSAVATYSISGKVLTSSGTPITGVPITLSGNATGSTTTDSLGRYKFTGLVNGSYTVTPSMTGYTFTPASRSVTITGANITGQNFRRNP